MEKKLTVKYSPSKLKLYICKMLLVESSTFYSPVLGANVKASFKPFQKTGESDTTRLSLAIRPIFVKDNCFAISTWNKEL